MRRFDEQNWGDSSERHQLGNVSAAGFYSSRQATYEAAQALEAAARKTDAGAYAGLRVDEATRTLFLYRKSVHGDPTTSLRTRLGDRPYGVIVRVVVARYSEAQLLAAAKRLGSRTSTLRAQGVQVASYGPLVDGSGLLVSVHSSLARADRLIREAASEVAQVRTAGLPRMADTRNADTPAYEGGALLKTPKGGCSAGWVVKNKQGQRTILTANHCASPGDAIKNGAGTVIGTVNYNVPAIDTLTYTAPSTEPYVFGDTITSSTKHSVVGITGGNVGEQVCSDGAYSGARCGAVITGKDETVTFYDEYGDPAQTIYPETEIHLSGGPVGGQGDSGSPVLQFPYGDNRVVIAGLFNGIISEGTCPNPWGSTIRYCGSTAYVIPADHIMSILGVTLP